MDGRAQAGIFNCSYEVNAKPQNNITSQIPDVDTNIYTENEIGEVEQRLKDLGYL
jgi:hypothetical protein